MKFEVYWMKHTGINTFKMHADVRESTTMLGTGEVGNNLCM
jgi:hypothetical protein